jgi:hypothetical protein
MQGEDGRGRKPVMYKVFLGGVSMKTGCRTDRIDRMPEFSKWRFKGVNRMARKIPKDCLKKS